MSERDRTHHCHQLADCKEAHPDHCLPGQPQFPPGGFRPIELLAWTDVRTLLSWSFETQFVSQSVSVHYTPDILHSWGQRHFGGRKDLFRISRQWRPDDLPPRACTPCSDAESPSRHCSRHAGSSRKSGSGTPLCSCIARGSGCCGSNRPATRGERSRCKGRVPVLRTFGPAWLWCPPAVCASALSESPVAVTRTCCGSYPIRLRIAAVWHSVSVQSVSTRGGKRK